MLVVIKQSRVFEVFVHVFIITFGYAIVRLRYVSVELLRRAAMRRTAGMLVIMSGQV